jgi:hypothetical protein
LLATPLSQGDKGKETTLEQSTDPTEEDITDEEIYSSTNPVQTIRKLVRKSNIELASLIQIRSQTQEIKERIKALMEKIHRYGVRKIFNYPIYLFWILIFILLQVLYKKLFIFTGVFAGF